ncbi:MAG: hypothetical protein BWY45_01124 [Euryarchaeota archaeon ADurb.Bin294]|nr:MAG: hypothetical protein BWY45_01124 [Euryarchaeota archaeon ADurb.Bin294]
MVRFISARHILPENVLIPIIHWGGYGAYIIGSLRISTSLRRIDREVLKRYGMGSGL